MRRTVLAGLALAMCAGPGAMAQQALYDPLPPKGSAYLRFFNALGQTVTVRPDFAPPQTLDIALPHRIGPYTVVENVQGRTVTVPLQAGDGQQASVAVTLAPGSYHTVLWLPGAGGITGAVVEDESQFNQLRTKLTFYNATADCPAASLGLVPDGPAVFQNVPVATGRMRAVNPVEAEVVAGCGGRQTPPFALKGLAAGGRSSIWLIMTPKGPQAFLTQDVTTVWRR